MKIKLIIVQSLNCDRVATANIIYVFLIKVDSVRSRINLKLCWSCCIYLDDIKLVIIIDTAADVEPICPNTTIMLLNAAKYWLTSGFDLSSDVLSSLYTRFKTGWMDCVKLQDTKESIQISIL